MLFPHNESENPRNGMAITARRDGSRPLLLVLDMQRGILERELWGKEALIANTNRLLDRWHAAGLPVILVRHQNRSFVVRDTPGWEIDPSLHTQPSDRLVDKRHSRVFREPAFTRLLVENGYDCAVICGVLTNGCVQAACLDAMAWGLATALAADAHSTWVGDPEAVVARWNRKLSEAGVRVAETGAICDRLTGACRGGG